MTSKKKKISDMKMMEAYAEVRVQKALLAELHKDAPTVMNNLLNLSNHIGMLKRESEAERFYATRDQSCGGYYDEW